MAMRMVILLFREEVLDSAWRVVVLATPAKLPDRQREVLGTVVLHASFRDPQLILRPPFI